MNIRDVSILIITKDRPKLLKKCLYSILNQTSIPNNVTVVEDTSDNKFFDKIKLKNLLGNKITVKYYETKSKNYSVSRNLTIKHCSTKIAIFLDDDIVIPETFVKDIITLFNKKKGAIGFIPKVIPIHQGLFSAAAADFHNGKFNKYKHIHKIKQCAFACIAIKKSILKYVKFDIKTFTSEDIILTRQLTTINNNLYYVPSLNVAHHFVNDPISFFKKNFFYARDYPYQTSVLMNQLDKHYYPRRKLDLILFPYFILKRSALLAIGDLKYFQWPKQYFFPAITKHIANFAGIYSSPIGRKKLIKHIIEIFKH